MGDDRRGPGRITSGSAPLTGPTAAVFAAIRDDFLADLPERLDELESSALERTRTGDGAALRTVAHRLAGAAGVFGEKALSLAADKLVDAIDARNERAIQRALEELRTFGRHG